MLRYKFYFYAALILSALFLSLEAGAVQEPAAGQEKYKDVEVVESRISIDGMHYTRNAYLHMAVKNNGDKKIDNIAIEISYYGEEDYLIQKALVKNALNDAIPAGEKRSYKIQLRGDFVNPAHEQYPYSKPDKVREFDIKVVDVKYGR